MRRARSEPCVFTREKDGLIDGLVLFQVDDSLGLGTESLLRDEEAGSKVFRRQPRVPITETPTTFNGLTICPDKVTVILSTTQTD